MKNKGKLLGLVFVIAAIVFCFSACGGKTLNNAEELEAYLNSQPVNSPNKPIKIIINAKDLVFPKISAAIMSSGKYVSLNLSGSPITTIPSESFYDRKTEKGCETLVSITIPDSVTVIDSIAFAGCTRLKSITIPSSVTSVGGSAFMDTAWFNNQPDGLVYVGKVAYQYKGTMPANTNIILLDGTKEIAGSAFGGCSNLTGITIPDSVTSIGFFTFVDCTSLTSITIPNSVTSIGDWAFKGCTGLTSITIGSSVTSIKKGAFQGCTSLTSVTIPDSVTSIGIQAFYGCTGLTSITIPNSVTSIEYHSFHGCTSLTSVTFQGTIAKDKLGSFPPWVTNEILFPFEGDLAKKYLAGGPGTYTTTWPGVKNSVWTKQ